MVQETEGTFKVATVGKIGEADLYTKTWLPDGPPKAKLIMVHGFSDHVGRYYDFFPSLARAGIAVYGFDQRGWGRSVKTPAQRGLTGPTSTVLADIVAFIRAHLPSEVPVFVLGHSMGGGEVATLASDCAYDDLIGQISGWLLESPFIGFTPVEEPSWLLVFSGRLAGRFLPHMHLTRPIPPEHVVRDPVVQQSIREDTLCHDTGTLEGLASMLDRTEALSLGKTKLSPKVRSLLHIHGDGDLVCSFDKAKAWFDRQKPAVGDATFKNYEGFYHQIHADPGKEMFYKDVADWILARCTKEGTEKGVEAAPAATNGPSATAAASVQHSVPESKL
ncbi:alpha/beta hydrolase [Apiospora saccharicola]|uniref:Alpha/beta hydrolase n=1 Tax=Apiospora saccharicola TaxID=335842 RepID=A0ABR1TKM5_9PEZI